MENRLITLIIGYLFIQPTNLQLLINVRNQGGDVIQENITANVSEDTVTLEFVRPDGVYVSQLVDFTNEVEALRVVLPAEEEAGGAPRTLCFLLHAAHADFIAPDAMAKLRQKNAGTVRVAEEDRGWRAARMSAWGGGAAPRLSPAAAAHCARRHGAHAAHAGHAAHAAVFLRTADLQRWLPRPGLEEDSVTPFPEGEGESACRLSLPPDQPCHCTLEVCVNWYPCGLKYCKGAAGAGAGAALSYRCGIKTCRRCLRLAYFERARAACDPAPPS